MTEEQSQGYIRCPTGIHFTQHEMVKMDAEAVLRGTSNTLEYYDTHKDGLQAKVGKLREIYPKATTCAIWFALGVATQAMGKDSE